MGCNSQKLAHLEMVKNYYKARDEANYHEIKNLMYDSITITSGDYIMPYSQDSFYEVFKWDSIFGTSYQIIDLKEKADQVIADVALQSARMEFLENSPMSCRYTISFKSGKISRIEELECEDADWAVWGRKVDSLVSWVHKNHPELDGFIHDMTMEGAIKYTKAMELYIENRAKPEK